MSDVETFKSKVEQYLEAEGISPTLFGRRFAGDPLFVFQLRDGREPRSSTRRRILTAMSTKEAAE